MPKANSNYVSYNIKSKRLKISNVESNNRVRVKELKFNNDNQVCEVFVGEFDNNVYNGHGTMLTMHDQYEGGFRDGLRDGFGKLVC